MSDLLSRIMTGQLGNSSNAGAGTHTSIITDTNGLLADVDGFDSKSKGGVIGDLREGQEGVIARTTAAMYQQIADLAAQVQIGGGTPVGDPAEGGGSGLPRPTSANTPVSDSKSR